MTLGLDESAAQDGVSALADTPRAETLGRCVKFLNEIGLDARIVPTLPTTSFLPDVAIDEGRLRALPSCHPSNLLHEAGHVAIVPRHYRTALNGNVSKGVRAMFADISCLDLDPDHALMRAALQASDPEATAWAWAAGMAIGLPPGDIIRDSEYEGTGAFIRAMLGANQYAGINGLVHAGMCLNPRRPGGYPLMQRWLQDVPRPRNPNPSAP